MELEFLLKLQEFGNGYLDMLFKGLTNIGHELTYIVIIMILYWCVSKRAGIRLILALGFSQLINLDVKNYFKMERPFILNPEIKPVYAESAPGFSFPSGHSQNAAAFWFYVSYMMRNKVIKTIAIIIPFIIAFSRLYLRVHWPKDVLVGLALGLITFIIIEKVTGMYVEKRVKMIHIVLYAVAFPMILIILSGLDANAIKMGCALAGGLLGFYIETSYINFEEQAPLGFQILKLILGVVVLLAIKEGLKTVLPEMIVFDGLRYFAMGIWATLFAPWLFVKLRLTSKRMF